MLKPKYVLVLILVFTGLFLFRDDFLALYNKYFSNIEKSLAGLTLEQVKTQFLAPPPLRGPVEETNRTPLSSRGIILGTTMQRNENGLGDLIENSKLNLTARAKVDDMFEKQYFAHVSPLEQDASDLAAASEYEFVIIGENLALGNYQNDEALVKAWMDSPGHRENILNDEYQEIGVAVKRGIFEGRASWLAVQIFGLPKSVCPEPDEALKERSEENQSDIDVLNEKIEAK